ncbi:putative lipoprotein [Streptomyces graminofaciens]|uniref:Lipoprotein n=2 Tax=Streptomyces graminofaciens TaxID=68212 RepID=A0ABM7FCS1_9ACTN|nr:putative lipoprotein [Streptomyces graminofaciens]
MSSKPTKSTNPAKPFIRRRGIAAAAAVIAAVMVTTTACSKTEDEGTKASASSNAESNVDTGDVDTGSDGGDSKLGDFKLPEGVPTELSADALAQWKNGGWQDFGTWASKAEDFANPYIEDFWTPERIAEAKENMAQLPSVAEAGTAAKGGGKTTQAWMPDGTVKKQNAAKVKATYHKYAAPVGKLFFTTPQGSSVCSAAVVKDPAHPGKSNMVWTAGHCVHAGKSGGWYRNIAFVPSFNNTAKLNITQASNNYRASSVSPYGIYWADWATTSGSWIKGGDASQGTVAAAYDYAVLHVKPEKGAKSLEERVGTALPVWFNAPAANKVKNMKVRGYPAEAQYDGSKMYHCQGATKRFVLGYSYPSKYPAQYMVGCTMNGGASGGPWFTSYKGKTYLVSNNSLSDRATFITGPRLGKNAKEVYLATSKKFK